MEHIDISNDSFTGSVELSAVPDASCTIDLNRNQFSGKGIVTPTEDRNVDLTESCIEMIVGDDGKESIDPRAKFRVEAPVYTGANQQIAVCVWK